MIHATPAPKPVAPPIRRHHNGEWQAFIKVPPCKAGFNLQVVWPAKPGQPIEIECDRLKK